MSMPGKADDPWEELVRSWGRAGRIWRCEGAAAIPSEADEP